MRTKDVVVDGGALPTGPRQNLLLAIPGVVLVLILILAGLSRQQRGPEALFDGRPVSAWALDLNSPSATTRAKALEEIQRFDSGEVPALVRLLHTADPVLGKAVRAIGPRLPRRISAFLIRMANPFEAPQKRSCAAQALKIMGPKSREAMPALGQALGDETTVSWFAALTLAEFGEPGITALTQALTTVRQPQSEFVCYALSTPGATASNAIPALGAALDKGYPQLAEKAASALACIGQAAVPRLVQSLGHREPRVRVLAARALSGIGPLARDALPLLLGMAEEDQSVVRQAAVEALSAIRPGIEPALSALAKAAKDPDRDVRLKAVQGLRWAPASSQVAVSTLVQALQDQSADVRLEAVDLLGAMAGAPSEAVSALGRSLDDENFTVRLHARQSLEKLVEHRQQAHGDEPRALQ